MSQTDFAPIRHRDDSLLMDMGVRVRIASLVKNDPSVVDADTYKTAYDTHKAAVQVDVDAEIAYHNGLAPLHANLHAANTTASVNSAKSAIVTYLGNKAVHNQP